MVSRYRKYLHLEIGDADLLRHAVHLAENMLHDIHAVDRSGIVAQLPAGDDAVRVCREVPDLAGQRVPDDIQVHGHGQPVVVAGGKAENAGVLFPQVQLHVPRADVGHGVFAGGVFHAPLPAVVHREQAAAGHIAALVLRHVEIVEAEHDAGKHCHTAQPSFCASRNAPCFESSLSGISGS